MAHAAPGRSGSSGDEADHRLAAAVLGLAVDERGGRLLGGAADLADEHDRLGLGIAGQKLQNLDEFHAFDRIAADADSGGLAQSLAGGLIDRLVGQRARARHDPHPAAVEDLSGHDADLAFPRGHDARAIRSDQPRFRSLQRPLHLHHVEHRDALGDAHDQRDLGLDRLADRVGGGGRRHVDDAGVAFGLPAGFGDGVEHRQAEMDRAALARRGAADHAGAVGDRLLGMERAVAAGESLAQHAGVLVDEHRHQPSSFTAATIFCAASSRSSAAMTLRPDSAITPSAMMSQRMMPPKMLTRMPFTFGSAVMILNAALTLSLEAPPPTSRKFAGAPP